MSIAKGLARAAKAAKKHNKAKSRQGNDLVGNRGEDGSLMTDKDWSNKMREEGVMPDTRSKETTLDWKEHEAYTEKMITLWESKNIKRNKISDDDMIDMRNLLKDKIDDLDIHIAAYDELGKIDPRMIAEKNKLKALLLEVETAYGERFSKKEFDWDDPYYQRDFYLK